MADQRLAVDELRVRYLLLDAGAWRIVDRSNQVVDGGHYRVDAQRTPPALDIVGDSGPGAGRSMLAIYELRGDELTVCYDLQGRQRPATLKARPDQPLLSITYLRALIRGVLAL